MHHVQELVREDFDRRMEFCELIEIRGNDFANNIVFFSDEASFEFHGNIDAKGDLNFVIHISKSTQPKRILL